MIINYRKLAKNDLAFYRKARLQCLKDFPEAFGSDYEEEKAKQRMAFEYYLEEENPDTFIFGAFAEGACIGLCGFIRGRRKKTKHQGDLIQMYVDKDLQGNGIGRKLMQLVMDEAFNVLGLEQIALGVVVTNKTASKLYEDMGFIEYGCYKNFFKTSDGYLDQRLMICRKQDLLD